MVTKLFGDVGPRFKARPGGYTRILHMMPRAGDAAPMALMQLVDGPAAQEPPAAAQGAPAKAKRAKAAPEKNASGKKATPRKKKAEAAPEDDAPKPKRKKKAAA